jgi:hypothetical protein
MSLPIELQHELIEAYYGGLIRQYRRRIGYSLIELDFDATEEKKNRVKNYIVSRYKIPSSQVTIVNNRIEIRI